MAGPWERYATPQGSGKPWERFAAVSGPGPMPEITREQAEQAITDGQARMRPLSLFASGAASSAANILDIPGRIQGQIYDLAGRAFPNAAAQAKEAASRTPIGTGDNAREAVERVAPGALDMQGQTGPEKAIRLAGEFAPGALLGASATNLVRPLATYALGPAIASEAAGRATEGVRVPDGVPVVGGKEVEPFARAAAALATGVGLGAIDDALLTRAAANEYMKSAPSADALRNGAAELYKRAEARGVVVPPQGSASLRDVFVARARRDGFVSPSGAVAPDAEGLKNVLNLLDEYAGMRVSVADMQALRRQIQRVADSPDAQLSRTGVALLKQYDDYMSSLAPELKTANALYTRARRGDMMDQTDELAEIRASQFSNSGFENALRTEYRGLDRGIAKGQVKGLRPDQAEAVRAVSRGTPASNTLRGIGKAAPTGVVSAGSAGVPFLIGNAFGGPAVGALAAGLYAGTGILGRAAATGMQSRAARFASAAMRQAEPFVAPNYGYGGLLGVLTAEQQGTQE